jgi:hypothetical protein
MGDAAAWVSPLIIVIGNVSFPWPSWPDLK